MAERKIRIVKAEARHPSHVQYGRRLISVPLPPGLPPYDQVIRELHEYREVLLGRVTPPVESPYLALAEVASAYYGRAREIEQLIYEGEVEGSIHRGDQYYRLRTGELTSFIRMASKAYDLGSRRLSQERLLTDQRIDSGEAY